MDISQSEETPGLICTRLWKRGMQRWQIILLGLTVIAWCAQSQGVLMPNAVSQTPRSADVVFVVDNSASMEKAISKVQTVLSGFANQIVAQRMDLRIIMISAGTGTSSHGICVPRPLGSGVCPNDQNVPFYRHITTNVGSMDSLGKFLSTYTQWKDSLRANASKTIVVVSDDNSRMSAAEFRSNLAALPSFQNHKFNAVVKGPLCGTASSENEYTKLAASTGGIFVDICEEDFGPSFAAMATAIIGNVVPPPPPPPTDLGRDSVTLQIATTQTHGIVLTAKGVLENADPQSTYSAEVTLTAKGGKPVVKKCDSISASKPTFKEGPASDETFECGFQKHLTKPGIFEVQYIGINKLVDVEYSISVKIFQGGQIAAQGAGTITKTTH